MSDLKVDEESRYEGQSRVTIQRKFISEPTLVQL